MKYINRLIYLLQQYNIIFCRAFRMCAIVYEIRSIQGLTMCTLKHIVLYTFKLEE